MGKLYRGSVLVNKPVRGATKKHLEEANWKKVYQSSTMIRWKSARGNVIELWRETFKIDKKTHWFVALEDANYIQDTEVKDKEEGLKLVKNLMRQMP